MKTKEYSPENIELGKRLLEIRTDLKYQFSKQIASEIEADPSYYAKAEKGGGLSDDLLRTISEKYNYNKAWLWFGEGEKKKGVKTPLASDAPEVFNTIDNILAINKIYADAHKVFADAHKKAIDTNAELAVMVKQKQATVNDLKQIQIAESAKMKVLQELLVEVGLGKNWKSPDEGKAKIHKLFSEAAKKALAADTHGGVSS